MFFGLEQLLIVAATPGPPVGCLVLKVGVGDTGTLLGLRLGTLGIVLGLKDGIVEGSHDDGTDEGT